MVSHFRTLKRNIVMLLLRASGQMLAVLASKKISGLFSASRDEIVRPEPLSIVKIT